MLIGSIFSLNACGGSSTGGINYTTENTSSSGSTAQQFADNLSTTLGGDAKKTADGTRYFATDCMEYGQNQVNETWLYNIYQFSPDGTIKFGSTTFIDIGDGRTVKQQCEQEMTNNAQMDTSLDSTWSNLKGDLLSGSQSLVEIKEHTEFANQPRTSIYVPLVIKSDTLCLGKNELYDKTNVYAMSYSTFFSKQMGFIASSISSLASTTIDYDNCLSEVFVK